MKSKKMLKFLVTSILIATVTTSNALVFAKKEKIKTVEVVENPKNVIKVKDEEIPEDVTEKNVTKVEVEESSKDTTEKEVYTKEEIENKIKEEYENYLENKKIETKNENDFSKKNQEIFKNFDENNYKVEGFNLTVYFKNGVPILLYEHIKTKAIIIIIPINNLNPNFAKTEKILDRYTFRAFKPDDRGLVHYLEHCVVGDELVKIAFEKNNKLLKFNAETLKDALQIIYNPIYVKDSFIKKLIKELKSPEMLKNENVFKIEKSRILNEAEKNQLDNINDEIKELFYYNFSEKFNRCGIPEELKKISPDEVKKYFEEIIHPSNLLVTKYLDLNPKEVKKYLTMLNEEYLKHYDYKEIFVEPFRKKENYDYRKIEACKKQNILYYYNDRHEMVNCDYCAHINFLDSENQKEKGLYHKYEILNYIELNSKKEKLELENFVKKLGYPSIHFNNLNSFSLDGNNKKLFEKEILQENSKKIFEFILKKFENFNDEEIEKNVKMLTPVKYNKDKSYEEEQLFFSNVVRFRKNEFLDETLIKNFINFKNPFSKSTLEITENNEIKDSKEYYINKIKKYILNLIKEFKNKTPSQIRVFFRTKNKKPDPEYLKAAENLKKRYIIPLKFKETKNKALVYFVKNFLISELEKEVTKRALNYYCPKNPPFIEDYIAFNEAPKKEIFKNELKFFEEDFEKFLKNLKINKSIFNKFKEDYEEISKDEKNQFKEIKKEFNKALKMVNHYLKHGLDENADVYNEKKDRFKIDSKTTRTHLYNIVPARCMYIFSNFEEYLNYKKLKSEFILKYGQLDKLKHKDVLVDKEFVKDLKKYFIEPLKKAIPNGEIINKIDDISYEDFIKTLKSCSLVEKETYEKDQKKLDEILRKNLGYSI